MSLAGAVFALAVAFVIALFVTFFLAFIFAFIFTFVLAYFFTFIFGLVVFNAFDANAECEGVAEDGYKQQGKQ